MAVELAVGFRIAGRIMRFEIVDWPEVVSMSTDVGRDQFVVIRVEGMHCHTCEQTIQKELSRQPGVHEVEVDFASGQASVLFDREAVGIAELMEAVNGAGYHAAGFTQRQADRTTL